MCMYVYFIYALVYMYIYYKIYITRTYVQHNIENTTHVQHNLENTTYVQHNIENVKDKKWKYQKLINGSLYIWSGM